MVSLDIGGCTAMQYASLILIEDMGYSYQRSGNRLGMSRYAAFQLYKRAKLKLNEKRNNIQKHQGYFGSVLQISRLHNPPHQGGEVEGHRKEDQRREGQGQA